MLLVISVAMFGASAGVRDAGHIGMDSLVMILPERAQFWCEVAVFVLSILFALALLAGGVEMATSTRNDTIPTLGISEAIRYAAGDDRRRPHHAVLDRAPDCTVCRERGGPIMALTVLCLSFVVFLLLGVPVAFAIGLSCLATFAVEGLPFETAIQMMTSGMNVFSFLAIPFFIFSGELMLHGGIADKIVNFARSLVGHWRGGLGLANVVASTLFGGVSGSPVADTSAMGGVMIPIMKREGYSAAYAVNVTTHASLSGALMPTSHNMIIYAFAAQAATGMIDGHVVKGVSIGDLMFAGLIPCFWIMVCMLVAAYWQAVQVRLSEERRRQVAGREVPGLERSSAHVHRVGPRAAGGPHHTGVRDEGHHDGDGSGCDRGHVLVDTYRFRLPHDVQEEAGQVAGQGVQDHRRDPAAHRRVQHAPLSDGVP